MDSRLNDVAGGNIDLRGVGNSKKQLFASDIPGLLVQYVDGLTIDDFKLIWTNPHMPWLTNGLEISNFKNVRIDNFQGTGAPNNPKAYPVKITNGEGFKTNLDKGSVSSINVK